LYWMNLLKNSLLTWVFQKQGHLSLNITVIN
jgi:hypothetical protein